MKALDKISTALKASQFTEDQAEVLAQELYDAVASELAGKIRSQKLKAPEGFVYRQSWIDAWNEGRDDSADLIDPEVEK
ncbi:hypothetical protein ACIPJG_32140 [Streptomyces halstedii]|uniref:hypothetical protein n=1 Tax=Streptomyces halstedii TaxID=1944 RepID=UPI00381D15AC